jgi:phosphate transport system substrate-binding protein
MRNLVCALAAAAALAAPALGQTDLKKLSGNIKIDGSSTVYPITEAVAEEFKKAAPNVNVTVGISGTGGGFKRFVVGETDISDASRPIKKEENDKAVENKIEYIEVPVAYDGLTIVVNNKNTWVDKLTVDEIKKIFADGAFAKTWKDVRPTWPDRPIKIFAPGTDSGTFDYFKEVVAGEKGAIRGDMSVSEDDNVLVRGVEGTEDAIGFFGCAYYFENEGKLKAVPVVNPKGEAVLPSPESVEGGTYAPFSRPLFIYVNKKSAAKPEVKAFVEFYLSHGPALVGEVGYVSLPTAIYSRVEKNFAAGKTGTFFLNEKGEKVHGPLTEVYK